MDGMKVYTLTFPITRKNLYTTYIWKRANNFRWIQKPGWNMLITKSP
jgi:hypothetical protein